MQKFLKVWTLQNRELGEDPKCAPRMEDVSSMVEMYLGIPKHLYMHVDNITCIVEMEFYYGNIDCRRYCDILKNNTLLLANLEIRISQSGQTTFFHAGHQKPKDTSLRSTEFLVTESRKRKFEETTRDNGAKTKYLKAHVLKNYPLTFYHVVKTVALFLGDCSSCRKEYDCIYLSIKLSSSPEAARLDEMLDETPILLNELEIRKIV
jgi:hypothetical protein